MVRVIDTRAAHRAHPDWVCGFAGLTAGHAERITTSRCVSSSGCHVAGRSRSRGRRSSIGWCRPASWRGFLPFRTTRSRRDDERRIRESRKPESRRHADARGRLRVEAQARARRPVALEIGREADLPVDDGPLPMEVIVGRAVCPADGCRHERRAAAHGARSVRRECAARTARSAASRRKRRFARAASAERRGRLAYHAFASDADGRCRFAAATDNLRTRASGAAVQNRELTLGAPAREAWAARACREMRHVFDARGAPVISSARRRRTIASCRQAPSEALRRGARASPSHARRAPRRSPRIRASTPLRRRAARSRSMSESA